MAPLQRRDGAAGSRGSARKAEVQVEGISVMNCSFFSDARDQQWRVECGAS